MLSEKARENRSSFKGLLNFIAIYFRERDKIKRRPKAASQRSVRHSARQFSQARSLNSPLPHFPSQLPYMQPLTASSESFGRLKFEMILNWAGLSSTRLVVVLARANKEKETPLCKDSKAN